MELCANRTAHTVARDFDHEGICELLMERIREDVKLALPLLEAGAALPPDSEALESSDAVLEMLP